MCNKISPIKYIVLAGLVVAGAAGILTPPALAADDNAIVHPDPLSVGMRGGEEKDISIRVDNVKNMYGIELQLKFDPKVVQVRDADPSKDGTQIAVGDWLDGGFVAANQVDNAKGTISFAATLLNPAPPVSGDGTVATIDFRAKADGTSPLKISKALLATRDAAEIKSQVQDGAIGVSALAQAPAVQKSSKSSNPTTKENNSAAPAIPGTTTLVLVGAAGVGMFAVVGAIVLLFGIVLLRRRS
jgi:hypothetical protein